MQVVNPYGTVVFTDTVTVASGVKVSANFTTDASPYYTWVGGTYTVKASWSISGTAYSGTSQFTFSGPSAAPLTTTTTPTVTVTSTAPPKTVTSSAPPVTQTTTAVSIQSVLSTQSVTSTYTAPASTIVSTSMVTTTTSVVPDWSYGVMVVLLLLGLAIGYVVKRPSAKQS